MKIREIMTRDVASCRVDDTLGAAASLFWTRDCGLVPVVDSLGRLTGVVTDRDVCMGALFSGSNVHDVPLRESMSRPVYACRADDGIEVALRLMGEHRVRRVPVVDGQDRVIGLVGSADLLRAAREGKLESKDVLETLATVTAGAPKAEAELVPAPRKAATPATQPTPSKAARKAKTATKAAARTSTTKTAKRGKKATTSKAGSSRKSTSRSKKSS